jgi:SPP1 gp7 family putative phage head morphogenesis protein
MDFKEFWKIENGYQETFSKSDKLTKSELIEVQNMIFELQQKGYPSGKIIKALQTVNKKLVDKWKAERAFWTESKRIETASVSMAGDELDVEKYRVVLSPHACETCRKAYEGKTFDAKDLRKDGRDIVPAHPNCYCILIPSD